MNKVFNFTQIVFAKIKDEVNFYSRTLYNKADQLFSPASPFGHIIQVVEDLYQSGFIYLKSTIDAYSLTTTNQNIDVIIKTNAIIAGHNPTRAISATGTLRIKFKNSGDTIAGNKITFANKARLKNNTNGLEYAIDLGGLDFITYNVGLNTNIYVNIVNGQWKEDNFTGDGTINQSFQINNASVSKDIENFKIQIYVNGAQWAVKNHLYEMIPDENAVVVRSAFDGGITIIMGGLGFGKIPDIGSNIVVKYILTDGAQGNIFRRTINDFSFIDQPTDGLGTTVDVANFFDTYINTDINFGADAESTQFTKAILPIASNNFVLATPQNYAYHIKKLGVFSYVNAYLYKDYIYINVTPNILLFKNQNTDYFSVSEAAFILDDAEKIKIDLYLKMGGNIQLTQKYKIISPILSRYVMNIFYIGFTDGDDQFTNNEILNLVSDYFLNFNRLDRIPTKDLINKLSKINTIDSLDISFISKKNEDYHINNKNKTGYDPNKVLGLDSVLGDILFEPTEYPIIRGGFMTRDGVFIKDGVNQTGLNSVNIIKKGVTDRKTIII